MSKARVEIFVPQSARTVWRFFVTRDSINGVLSSKCTVWDQKPVRTKHRIQGVNAVTWLSGGTPRCGEYYPTNIAKWWRTYPETDLELIKIETFPTAKQIADQTKRAPFA